MIQTKTDRLSFQEKQYVEVATNLSGVAYDIDLWEKSGFQKRHLEEQSRIIAEKLNQGYYQYGLGWKKHISVDPYTDRDLYLLGLHTKGVRKVDQYRNISIIPVKGRQQRNKTIKELTLFVHENPKTRSWLFTDRRQKVGTLRETIQRMHRRLSRLNHESFMKLYGARFVFRTTELGEIFPLGKSDVSVHPHMHALMCLDKKLTKKQFINLNRLIQKFWGAYSRDSGIIRNPREMVKYCVKPNDLLHLNSEQLIKIYYAQNRLHLVQPLADLKTERRKIRENNQKVIIRKGIPHKVPNWNRSTTKKSKADPMREYLECLEDQTKANAIRESGHATPRIVAWCTPSPLFTHVTEPVFLVHGLDGRDPVEIFEREEVQKIEHAIMVHTNTLTVRNNNQENSQKNEYISSTSQIPPKNPETTRIDRIHNDPF